MEKGWDPVAFKALLRTTSQRLGQLQERKDSQGKQTRRDIATCLSQGQLALARAKAATLVQEDAMGDLLEELEMLVGTVGRHVGELRGTGRIESGPSEYMNGGGDGDGDGGVSGRMGEPPRLSSALAEAASSIIHAAPSTESKDLSTVREALIRQLGPVFAQTASASQNNGVSTRIMQILSSPPPTASRMDAYLVNIAQMHGVKWTPEPRREDLFNVISEILRVDAGSSPIVDLPRLREICARGLPDDPPWVRPRVWKLLFGTLPILKSTWTKESQKQRGDYYDLVRRLLSPFSSLPSPTDPLSSPDALLARISDSLSRVSPDLFAFLGDEPKSFFSGKCSLGPTAPGDIQISCAPNLDKRLSLLKGDIDTLKTPEIRLETDLRSSETTSLPPLPSSTVQRQQTTLLPSKAYNAPPVHHAHISALLRLLYIHSTLNPAVRSPHVPWLLIPLYSVFVGETNADDAAHAEADTFWVFEALIGEIAEMEEEEGRKFWTRKLSERVRWADETLATSLHSTGLDPIHPHYSYRWLAPLLAQTLPLASMLPVWDVIFACPMRTRDGSPKLDYLVDICTALLVRARAPLFRLGKPGQGAPGLWTQEYAELRPPSPLRPWELSDAFTQGIALLTSYPIDAAGGIDRILQTASDLAQKRIEAKDREKERTKGNVGFGARITQRMWRGFTNQVADGSPEEEEEGEEDEDEDEDEAEEHEDGNETETPAAPTLTSRLANTVWRGITNQSSMDDEVPSPPSPLSARHSPTLPEEHDTEASAPSSQANLWNYAGKLKESDTIAAFSKVSTNFRAKALDALRVRKESNASSSSGSVVHKHSPFPSSASETAPRQSGLPNLIGTGVPSQRRGSLPGTPRESERADLDPPRPTFFRSPRESFLPQPRRQHFTAPSSPVIPPAQPPDRHSDTESNGSLIRRAGTSLASLATFSSSHAASKNVPRPLMLSSRDRVTTKSPQPPPSTLSEGGMSEYRRGTGQWGDVYNHHALRQASVSSTSSLSTSEVMNRLPFSGGYARSVGTGPRSDYDSDGSAAGTSRRVALNRKSVSPMALASRSLNLPWNTPSPGPGRGAGHPLSNGSVTAEDVEKPSSERGRQDFDSEERVHASGMANTSPSMGMATTTGFDSPTTKASPAIQLTLRMPPNSGPGVERIANGGSTSGGHDGESSLSTMSKASEDNTTSLEPSAQGRLLMRKKTPPAILGGEDGMGESHHRETLPSSESEDMSIERTPLSRSRLRSKRYATRPENLRLRSPGVGVRMSGQRTPSPGQRNLTAEWPGDHDLATTPRADSYLAERVKEGEEGVDTCPGAIASRPPCVRKLSKEARSRRVSPGRVRDGRRTRESGAEEGDDEGYDELLSAYESEGGSRE